MRRTWLPPLGGIAFALLGLALTVAPAGALMAPEYYERARKNAADVIVLKVTGVTAPEASFGNCTVQGTVAKVERGSHYAPGSAMSVEVPCRKPGAQVPLGPVLYNAVTVLESYPFARAYLQEDGRLSLYQYHPLKTLP